MATPTLPLSDMPLSRTGPVERLDKGLLNHLSPALQSTLEKSALVQSLTPAERKQLDTLNLQDRLAFFCWLGQIARRQKAFKLAQILYEEATRTFPQSAELLNNWANCCIDQQQLEQACGLFQRAIALKPSLVAAHYGLGLAYRHLNKTDLAFACFKQTLRLQPDYLNAYVELAQVLTHHQQWNDAQFCLDEALKLNPTHGPVYEAHGLLAMQQKQPHQALDWYEKAARHTPVNASLYSNLANCLMSLEAYAQALPYLTKALAMNPGLAMAHYNQGVALGKLGRTADACQSYAAAVQHKPGYVEARFNRSLLWLKQGDYPNGWAEYETRRDNDAYYRNRTFQSPFWQGEPLAGKTLLITAEQGFGDLVQFARFIPQVKALGATVLLECAPELRPLYEGFPWINQMLEKGAGSEPNAPACDFVVYLMSLPHHLGCTLENLPAPVVPLAVGQDLQTQWSQRLRQDQRGGASLRNIGICWASKYSNITSLIRSCMLDDFAPLLDVPDTRWVTLQKGLPYVEAEQHPMFSTLGSDRWLDLSTEIGSFLDTAAIIRELDLVITVDTVIAHLAGSLGKPVWVLVPFQSDWRWLEDRTDSPWYPSARLFRAQAPGQWKPVFAEIKQALISIPV